jgi:hypothetical protein
VQHEPPHGKVDLRPIEKEKMADRNQITLNPVVQTGDTQSELPGGTSEIIRICRNSAAGGGEDRCPLWDGHIIDAAFPLM